MGHKHSRDDILGGAVEVAFADGLGAVTFGRVARHVGTSDRMVVYYFASKETLVAAVLAEMGARLQATLAPTFATPAATHLDLVRAAWPVLARPGADAVFALFFEAIGLATGGREPYRAIVPRLVQGWIDWTGEFVTGPAAHRRAEAAAAVAMLDGLLLLRQLAGPAVADRAARRMLALPPTG